MSGDVFSARIEELLLQTYSVTQDIYSVCTRDVLYLGNITTSLVIQNGVCNRHVTMIVCKTNCSCACRKAAVICNLNCHPHNHQCSNVN